MTLKTRKSMQVLDIAGEVNYPILEDTTIKIIHSIWEAKKKEKRGVRSLTYDEPCSAEKPAIGTTLLKGDIDLIVLGNNRDYGLYRARLIPPDMRADRTCIVWNNLPETQGHLEHKVRPYREIGFNTFLSRRDFEPYFVKKFS